MQLAAAPQYAPTLQTDVAMRQVLWDVETGNAICGTPTCTDFTIAVKFLNNDAAKLVTCGNYNLHVWHYDHLTNKLVPSDVQLGQLRRCFTCLTVDAADQYMYCGSATGDVLQVRLHAPSTSLPCQSLSTSCPLLHCINKPYSLHCKEC